MMRYWGLSFTVLICALASPAAADWPLHRHDAKRTGAATGVSDLADPVPYFRYYLGGALSGAGLITHDVDGDGADDLIYLAGGAVIASKSNADVLWQSAPRGYGSIIGIDDLNGDGSGDLVLYTRVGTEVLDATTGVLQWVEPEGEMGTLSGVAIGDLDGDGLPDLLMQECGCCGVNSGNQGYVYSFAGGFANASLLYELPYAACGATRSLLLVDADGTPPLEVMNNTYNNFNILDGTTGAILASTGNLGTWIGSHYCRGHNVDGLPGDEILCVLNENTSPATNQRRITALKYTGGATPTLTELWPHVLVAPDADGDVIWSDPFVDLDGDGDIEIIISTKDATEVWQTRIFDAATGTEITSISDRRIVGTVEVEEVGKALIITINDTTLHAYAFDGTTATYRWSLANHSLLFDVDWALRPVTSMYGRVVTIDLNGDGLGELITKTETSPQKLVAHSATSGVLIQLYEHIFPASVEVVGSWLTPPIDTVGPQIAIARNDGFLTLYDDQLVPTNDALGLSADPGIRIGGFYAAGAWRDLQHTPLTAALDGLAKQDIVVRDSRSALLRLDASAASLASPPAVIWERQKTFGPSLVPNLDPGHVGIAAFAVDPVDPTQYRVVALRADGTELWNVPLEGIPYNDLLPADFDLNGTTDLVFQWGDPNDTLQQFRALSGSNGAALWNGPPHESGSGRQPAGISVFDQSGDGRPDVLFHGAGATRILSGADGTEIVTSLPVGGSYHMPTVFDTDGDAVEEVVLHASNAQPKILSNDLQTQVWIGTDDDRPYPYAAFATCPAAAPLMIAGSWAFPARLKLTELSGASQGSTSVVVLAGGNKYPSESAAKANGEYLGQLTSATVHSNLTGTGQPTVLIGSADGWLYGLNPCTESLDFAVDFGTAVGEAVFGDTDGNGRDEILVTAADGYLYGLKNKALDPPTDVLDTDPDNGITGQDVDNIVSTDKLSGTWQGTLGASSYEVAIVQEDMGIVSAPPWQDVGNVTEASVTGLPLVDGERYFFYVRAKHPNGDSSVDVSSDGVFVQVPSSGTGGSGGTTSTSSGVGGTTSTSGVGGATGGAGGGGGAPPATEPTVVDGGCGCRVTDSGRPAWLWLLLAALAGLARSRRRHR